MIIDEMEMIKEDTEEFLSLLSDSDASTSSSKEKIDAFKSISNNQTSVLMCLKMTLTSCSFSRCVCVPTFVDTDLFWIIELLL